MFCPHCGTQLPDNAKFCGACGAQMPQPTAAPRQAAESLGNRGASVPSPSVPSSATSAAPSNLVVLKGLLIAASVVALVMIVWLLSLVFDRMDQIASVMSIFFSDGKVGSVLFYVLCIALVVGMAEVIDSTVRLFLAKERLRDASFNWKAWTGRLMMGAVELIALLLICLIGQSVYDTPALSGFEGVGYIVFGFYGTWIQENAVFIVVLLALVIASLVCTRSVRESAQAEAQQAA